MKATEKLGAGTLSALAGLTMVATAASSSLTAMADEAVAQNTPNVPEKTNAQVAVATLAQPTLVKAAAVGVFSYDQTTVSPIDAIARLQGATDVLCGAKDVQATMSVDALAWTITVTGDVENEFTATMGELVGEDSVNQLMTCSCGGNPAGGRAIVTADVKGVPIEYLLARAGASASANTVTFVSADGTEVAMPIGYVIGRHGVLGCELNGEDLYGALDSGNQLWLAKTPANYFLRDVVTIVVSTEEEDNIPAAPGSQDEHPNSPNAGILTGEQA